MKVAFADTSFYQALLNPKDNWHDSALSLSVANDRPGRIMEIVCAVLGLSVVR